MIWSEPLRHKRLTVVEPVNPQDIIAAHLGGCANRNIWIRVGHHGRLVVLGECIPDTHGIRDGKQTYE